jgi:choline-sulfatase
LNRAVVRLSLAAGGAEVGAAVVAIVEARSAAPREATASFALAELGVLAPLALALGVAVGIASLFLEPDRVASPLEHLGRLRSLDVRRRGAASASIVLATFAALGWCVTTAQIARRVLCDGAPAEAGIELAVVSLALVGVFGGLALACVRPVGRALGYGAASDPALAIGVATAIAVLGIGAGLALGDAGGDGRTPLAIFGVLRRHELDLRPLGHIALLALVSYAIVVSVARRGGSGYVRSFVGIALVVASLVLTAREARALDPVPEIAHALETDAPLGRIALALDRRATDRDHDGASALFAGGDCNDSNLRVGPNAIEIAGNGVDEDCDGVDLPALRPKAVAVAPTPPKPFIDRDFNLVFITIDTLRPDVGFMGYPLRTTPNLDALAARSTVYERAYSMASYTGKSIGPLFIGKYPSETIRDGAHFTKYAPQNIFLAERLKGAGFHTMGCASFWYFRRESGLAQGIDDWDVSAIPNDYKLDTDTATTSDKVTDAAIRLLSRPEATSGRFYLWAHYFDPHAQYVPHAGAPNFYVERGPASWSRAAYDGEVWFTDQHVGRLLDFIESSPWGKNTVIVVTADHGEAFGEHGVEWHGTDLWEPLVRVPLVIYVPGATPHRVPKKRSHIDLVPTLLDLMRVAQPADDELSGESMLPDIAAKPGGEIAERDVYIDMPAGPVVLMRRALIHGPTPGLKLYHLGGSYYRLFDLANDPDEASDLVTKRPLLHDMIEQLQAKRATLREIEVPPDANAPR